MAIPGTNIRTLRRQMGLSLEVLAKLAGVDSGTLSKLENGKGGYSDESIKRIASALSVSVEVLFSPPDKVEGAAILAREAPVLTPKQLAEWRGVDSMEFKRGQEFLYGDPRRLSRHVFGWRVTEASNAPFLQPTDELIFDANKQPVMGSFVIAQDETEAVHLGRFRRLANRNGEPVFEVVPYDSLYPGVSSATTESLRLRGTLVELHRTV